MPSPVVVPGALAHFNLAFEDTKAPTPWQDQGSNLQPSDSGIPGPFPIVGPAGGQRRDTERQGQCGSTSASP